MSAYEGEAGGSAGRWAKELRDGARRGVWRRVASLLGFTAHTRRADAQAAAAEAGKVGEEWTARLLGQLPKGWTVLHDRALPGAGRANADHVVISPAARVYLIDSKLWNARDLVYVAGGRLFQGRRDRSDKVAALEFERDMVARALRTPVTALMAVHTAPIAGGGDGFWMGDIPVVPASRLLRLLMLNDGQPNPGALWLVQAARSALPPYRS